MARREESPPHLRSLLKRIDNLARDRGFAFARVQRTIANTVVGQMVPPGIIKGGTAMKLRRGEAGSRFSPDVDTARPAATSQEDFVAAFAERRTAGWDGFTGPIEPGEGPSPAGVAPDYVMQPFTIRLFYKSKHWLNVPFELGHDEVGSTEASEVVMAQDTVDVFETLGLELPEPVPVLRADHQIAQKLHASTAISQKTGANERAHDLVDLQLLVQNDEVDLAEVKRTAVRLFTSRRAQPWPPTVEVHEGWDTIYEEAADGLPVVADVDAAVVWANDLVQRIDEAEELPVQTDGSD